jgi:hypothetical protein
MLVAFFHASRDSSDDSRRKKAALRRRGGLDKRGSKDCQCDTANGGTQVFNPRRDRFSGLHGVLLLRPLAGACGG